MARAIRGRAGRENRRSELLAEYGATLAPMILSQARPDPDARVLVLGSPGAVELATALALRLSSGEVVVCVYTFDEVEEARAGLAGLGNVNVIDELSELDEDEPPFDLITCIAPYYLGRDAVISLIEEGVQRMQPGGLFLLAGDKQQELARYSEALSALATETRQVGERGQYRVLALRGEHIRRAGRLRTK